MCNFSKTSTFRIYSEIVCHFLGSQNVGVKLLRGVCTKLLLLNINKLADASFRPASFDKVEEQIASWHDNH